TNSMRGAAAMKPLYGKLLSNIPASFAEMFNLLTGDVCEFNMIFFITNLVTKPFELASERSHVDGILQCTHFYDVVVMQRCPAAISSACGIHDDSMGMQLWVGNRMISPPCCFMTKFGNHKILGVLHM